MNKNIRNLSARTLTVCRNSVASLLFALFLTSPVLAESTLSASAPLVDINAADAAELSEGLKGIGPAKAVAIVEFRDANGPFETKEDLQKVPGIGPSTFEQNVDSIEVNKE